MLLRVELYGIARQRAGVPHIELELPGSKTTLAEALRRIADELPEFGRECLSGGTLQPTLSANLAGERFVSEPATVIESGQTLLILSADAGG
jgi:molybdopterin converting factor small subunit